MSNRKWWYTNFSTSTLEKWQRQLQDNLAKLPFSPERAERLLELKVIEDELIKRGNLLHE